MTGLKHHIEFVSRDRTGIVAVVTSFGVIDAHAAIDDIRTGRASFYAGPTAWDRSPVTALDAFGGSYLFANWDGTRRNNLHELAAERSAPPRTDATPTGSVRSRFGTPPAIARAAAALRRRRGSLSWRRRQAG